LNKNSIIYLSGHKGLIGSAIYKILKKNNYKNIIVKDKKTLDLTNQVKVNLFFKKHKPEIVIHAARNSKGILENIKTPYDIYSQNLLMGFNTIKSAYENSVKRFIYLGSSCVYPNNIYKPIKEEHLFNGKLEKTSMSYALSIISCLQMCLSINKQINKNIFLPIIPNTVYGENDNFDLKSAHVLPALIRRFHLAKVNNYKKIKLWGNGDVKREFIYSDDFAEACIVILKSNIKKIKIPINVGVGKDYTIKKLAKIIAKKINYNGTIVWNKNMPEGAKRKILDNTHIKRLGWRPKISIEEGVSNTYRWYMNNNKYI